jgi:hypothetical protein
MGMLVVTIPLFSPATFLEARRVYGYDSRLFIATHLWLLKTADVWLMNHLVWDVLVGKPSVKVCPFDGPYWGELISFLLSLYEFFANLRLMKP